jgi:hypothetical protein
MYFQFPGAPKPERINFHRIWNSDADRFIETFPHALEDSSQAPARGNEPHGDQIAPGAR